MRVFKPQSPFLSGFTASEREALLAAATRRRFKPAAVITRHGEPATKMFLIVKGRARYFVTTPDGRKVILLWSGAGRSSTDGRRGQHVLNPRELVGMQAGA